MLVLLVCAVESYRMYDVEGGQVFQVCGGESVTYYFQAIVARASGLTH